MKKNISTVNTGAPKQELMKSVTGWTIVLDTKNIINNSLKRSLMYSTNSAEIIIFFGPLDWNRLYLTTELVSHIYHQNITGFLIWHVHL